MGRGAAKHPLSAPLPFAAMVLCVIATFLALDHYASPGQQLLLGAATWAILIASCRLTRAAGSRQGAGRRAGGELRGGARLDRARRLHLPAREPAGLRPAGPRARLPRGVADQPVGGGSATSRGVPRICDRHRRGLGRGRAAAARPDRRARRDHRSGADLRPAARSAGNALCRGLPHGRLPRDLRDLDRGMALGRDRARHGPARGQPAERDRGDLRALRRRRDRASAPPAPRLPPRALLPA